MGLGSGLLETRSVLITSRTPMEARSRSLIAALTWLVSGLVGGLVSGLAFGLVLGQVLGLSPGLVLGLGFGLVAGLVAGLDLALRNGGWFVLLQKVAHRRLVRDGNLPRRLYDFLDWGVDTQLFRRVGGGVRFRHNLIQQHLASTSADAG
jgi:F0F1-type ATP synthase assembly protein I